MNEQALMDRYIEIDSERESPAYARLREGGAEMWALIAYLHIVGGDLDRLAQDYGISTEAARAAGAYYKRHRAPIDARILLNAPA